MYTDTIRKNIQKNMAGEHVIVPPKNRIPSIKHMSYSTPTQTQEKKQIYFRGPEYVPTSKRTSSPKPVL